jgi:phosphatidylinositol glycan class H protein
VNLRPDSTPSPMYVRHHDDARKPPAEAMLQLLQSLTSPPSQTLTVTQPTPSSVCFTVSTRHIPNTVTAYSRHYGALLLRLVIGGLALLTLVAKWALATSGKQWMLNNYVGADGETWLLAHALQQWPWRNVVAGVATILWLVLRRGHTGTRIPSPF